MGHTHLLTYGPLLRLCKSNVKHAYSMYRAHPPMQRAACRMAALSHPRCPSGVKAERPSPPHSPLCSPCSPPPSPLCRTRAPERVRHGQAKPSSSPLLLPPLCPSSVRTKLGITFSSFRRPFLRPSPAAQPARAPSATRSLWLARARAWPGRSGSSQAEQDSPTGPLCSLGAPPPLLRRR